MNNEGNSKKIVMMFVLLAIAVVLILGALNSGYKKQSGQSSVLSGVDLFTVVSNNTTGLVKLGSSKLNWEFYIPAFLLNEENSEYKIYSGQMAEISNNRFVYRSAPYIDGDADVIGDYDKYEYDKTYDVAWASNPSGFYETDTTEDEGGVSRVTRLRYRTDGKTTIVNYQISGISCGLKLLTYNGYEGQEALLSEMGILVSQLVECEAEVEKGKQDEKEVDKNEQDSMDTGSKLREFDIHDLGFKVSLPDEGSMLSVITDNAPENGKGRVVVMIDGRIVAYIANEVGNTDVYGSKELGQGENKGEWVLNYVLSNPFNVGTPEYDQYDLIIKSLDTISNEFKAYSSAELAESANTD